MDLTKHGETCLTELLWRSAEHEAGVRPTARRLGIDVCARNIDANGLRYMPDITCCGAPTLVDLRFPQRLTGVAR